MIFPHLTASQLANAEDVSPVDPIAPTPGPVSPPVLQPEPIQPVGPIYPAPPELGPNPVPRSLKPVPAPVAVPPPHVRDPFGHPEHPVAHRIGPQHPRVVKVGPRTPRRTAPARAEEFHAGKRVERKRRK